MFIYYLFANLFYYNKQREISIMPSEASEKAIVEAFLSTFGLKIGDGTPWYIPLSKAQKKAKKEAERLGFEVSLL